MGSSEETGMGSRKKKAFTMAELLMALSVASIVGLAVVGVASALDNAYDRGEGKSEAVQTCRAVLSRAGALLRKSQLVIHAGSNRILLWESDVNKDGQIQIGEMAILTHDIASQKLTAQRFQVPEGSEAHHSGVLPLQSLRDQAEGVYSSFATSPAVEKQLWGERVDALSISVSPTDPFSEQVNLQVTARAGETNVELTTSIYIRSSEAKYVSTVEDEYVLAIPPRGKLVPQQ